MVPSLLFFFLAFFLFFSFFFPFFPFFFLRNFNTNSTHPFDCLVELEKELASPDDEEHRAGNALPFSSSSSSSFCLWHFWLLFFFFHDKKIRIGTGIELLSVKKIN